MSNKIRDAELLERNEQFKEIGEPIKEELDELPLKIRQKRVLFDRPAHLLFKKVQHRKKQKVVQVRYVAELEQRLFELGFTEQQFYAPYMQVVQRQMRFQRCQLYLQQSEHRV